MILGDVMQDLIYWLRLKCMSIKQRLVISGAVQQIDIKNSQLSNQFQQVNQNLLLHTNSKPISPILPSMKYIFRYTILSTFPHPDNKITQWQLSQALQSVNFESFKYNLNVLEQLSRSCIQKLLTRPQQKVLSIIEDSLNSQTDKNVPSFNSKELETIWQQQKVNVYKAVLQGACPSNNVYKDAQWSVKNVIMRRGQNLSKANTLLTKLNINCLENTTNPSEKTSLTITINKKGVEKIYNSLVQCQTLVNQILMSEE